jgi:hypothetical protein
MKKPLDFGPMKPKDYANARKKWVRWIGVIAKDIQDLVIRDLIFRKSMETVSRTKRIKPSNRFYRWTGGVYGVFAAMGIRRHLEVDSRVYSLSLLLKKIQNNPQALTRKWFAGQYGKGDFAMRGEMDFDRLFGMDAQGNPHQSVPQSFIDADVAELQALNDRTWRVFNRLIAHKERLRFGIPKKYRLTYQHVHDGVALLDKIACRWIYVLEQRDRKTLLPSGDGIDYQADVDEVWA